MITILKENLKHILTLNWLFSFTFTLVCSWRTHLINSVSSPAIFLVWLPLPGKLLQIRTLEKLLVLNILHYSSQLSEVECSFHFQIIWVFWKWFPQSRRYLYARLKYVSCILFVLCLFQLYSLECFLMIQPLFLSLLSLIGIWFHCQWSRSFRWRVRKWKQEKLFLCNYVAWLISKIL